MPLRRIALVLTLAALTIPSALSAQERQYPQYRTNNVPSGRPAPPAPQPYPPRPPHPHPRPPSPHQSGRPWHNHNHNGYGYGYNDRPYRADVLINATPYLETPVPQEPQQKPKPKPTKRPANAPDVFDSYSTK